MVDKRFFQLSRYSTTLSVVVDRLNFSEMLAWGLDEGTLGIIYHNIDRLGIAASKDFVAYCKQLQTWIQAKNIIMNCELENILTRFHNANIDCITIKGAFLINYVYCNLSTRSMSDVDIVVNKHEAASASRILKECNYYPELDPNTSLELSDGRYVNSILFHNRNSHISTKIHLHWHFLNASLPIKTFEKISLDDIWKNSILINFKSTQMRVLRPEHAVLLLCEHAMKHSFSAFVHISDICAMLDRLGTDKNEYLALGLDFNKLESLTKQWRLETPVNIAFKLIKKYLQVPIDYNFFELSGFDGRFFSNQVLSNKRWNGLSAFGYLSMLPTIREKILFVKDSLFPNKNQIKLFNKKPTKKTYLGRITKAFKTIATNVCVH